MSVMLKMITRFAFEPSFKSLWNFLHRFAWKGHRSISLYKKRMTEGRRVPPFVFISVTGRCNLSCQGCWVTPTKGAEDMPPEMLDDIIANSKRMGNFFFGILGGEPLLYPGLLDILAKHPDCYFQIFTNGILLDGDVASDIARLGNITPLISIEGIGASGDLRRGGSGVADKAIDAVRICSKNGIITGVATSVCKSNIDDLVNRKFVDSVASLGALYLWYYIYRPVGPRPNPELALSEDEIIRLRRFLVDERSAAPLALIDSYWDADGKAFCPAAECLSIHINPAGYIEPCPPVQFSGERYEIGCDLEALARESKFLAEFAGCAKGVGHGCILMDRPEALAKLVRDGDYIDSSGRDGLAELDKMGHVPGHNIKGGEIPEKSLLYRFAKKQAFFGFGAYG
ncbi:MAG: radical SAM protein [Planctomycetes bacterium]|nr:radical SAM protein [Planctomycetota bacterium]